LTVNAVKNMHTSDNPVTAGIPGVVICVRQGGDAADWVKAIRAGIEEEQVPCRTVDPPSGSAVGLEMAQWACRQSAFGIGIGCRVKDGIVLQHVKLPADRPFVRIAGRLCNAHAARIVGTNAARLVKGTALELSKDNGHR